MRNNNKLTGSVEFEVILNIFDDSVLSSGIIINKPLTIKASFNNGLPDGLCRIFHGDKPLIDITYKNGVKHGVMRSYNNRGELVYSKRFYNDKPRNSTLKYYEKGRVIHFDSKKKKTYVTNKGKLEYLE